MKEFVLFKNIKPNELVAIYGKIVSFNSTEAIANLELKDSVVKLVFSSKKQLKKIMANNFFRVIGNLVYNNNESVFNVKSISLINDFDLNLLLKIIELEKKSGFK